MNKPFAPADKVALTSLAAALVAKDLDQALVPVSAAAQQGRLDLAELISFADRLSGARRSDDAIGLYRTWLANTRSPLAFAACFNLGVILSNAKDAAGAEAVYRQALEINPGFVQARLNLGSMLEQRQQPDLAVEQWRLAVATLEAAATPDKSLLTHALNHMGRVLELQREFQQAEQALTKSLAYEPKQPDVILHLVHLRQKQCEWPVYKPLPGISKQELMEATSALAMLSASNDPAMQLAVAQRFVDTKVVKNVAALADRSGYGHQRLRIGYLSSDLCLHAVAILTAELFELHDRSQFEIFAFSWSREDSTPMRARLLKAMDHYVPIKEMGDEEAARCIRTHEIDILIDLQGQTSGARASILSYRPAPVQISYLGFPGPAALPEVDYVLADSYVLPPELEPYFTEQPLRMPHCFQINDRQREVGPQPTRANCGLPEAGFVFCSFNGNYKFSEEMFAVWMRILRRVPDSVLWLVADNPWAQQNLLRQAEQQGVDRARVLFAQRVGPAEYLARYQAADLFLDSFPFNAGTTASDALWAGLPLLTCSGRTFASRMAGSLLLAVDLPELITNSLEAYEEKAVSLAHDRARIEGMKRHLKTHRDTCRLFDSPGFVRDLEALLKSIAPGAASHEPADDLPMRLPPLTRAAAPPQMQNYRSPLVWGLANPSRFYQLIDEALTLTVPGHYLGDNLISWGKSNSMFADKGFVAAWDSNIQSDADRSIVWRRFILACAAYHCSQLAGDFVECGVYRGSAIKTVIDYFGKDSFSKRFWGYDTFDVDPAEGRAFDGQQVGDFAEVQRRFEGYDQVRLVKGFLPQSLIGNAPTRICYLHLDLNNVEGEIAILDHLFERVVSGGIIIIEGHERAGNFRNQKAAEDAWLDQRKHKIFPLPTGQGLVLKR